MPTLFKTYRVLVGLVAVLLVSAPSEFITADEVPQASAEESMRDFRADIVIDGEENRSASDALKNQLLVEKLIKMGRAKSQGCTRCHGRLGMQSLANAGDWDGSIAEYVVRGLTAFRDGKRSHEVMSSIAAALSDQDIALIAVWYQSVSKPSTAK